METKIQLSRKTYLDKVYGCWLGKNIGGTLGAPYEGRKYVQNLSFFEPVPTKPLPNDDLDLQLVWLKMFEDKGAKMPTLTDFAEYWKKYLTHWPCDEYGFCLQNLEKGLMPPISGCFENGYIDNMGSPIRSEIWACIAPAKPQLAARLAFKDSALDHAGGEGTYGEMFWAAVESAAFVISDPEILIKIGLSMIPTSCLTSRVIRHACFCFETGVPWAQARNNIAELFSNPCPNTWSGGFQHPCFAIPNFGFTVIGWLYGKDFGDKLLKAVNCGYDTDCTGATLGSLLGIISGGRAIPTKWKKPVGEKIILHKLTSKFNAPKTIGELVRRTEAVADKFMQNECREVSIGAQKVVPSNVASLMLVNDEVRDMVSIYEPDCAEAVDRDLQVLFHYNGDPVIYPGLEKQIRISFARNDKKEENGRVELSGPKGLKITKTGDSTFTIYTAKVTIKNKIKVNARLNGKTYTAEFLLLGPTSVKPAPYDRNVERCPKCQGRLGSCLCKNKKG